MSRRNNLGPLIAITAAAITLGSVTAGFIVTGGLGDARNKRLDVATWSHIENLGIMASCAFAINGNIPASADELESIVEQVWPARTDVMDCSQRDSPHRAATKVEYSRIDSSHLRLCGTFRSPATQRQLTRLYAFFPALGASRPAGRLCYELDMSVVGRAPQPDRK